MICPSCGYRVLDHRDTCRRCGTPLRGTREKSLEPVEAGVADREVVELQESEIAEPPGAGLPAPTVDPGPRSPEPPPRRPPADEPRPPETPPPGPRAPEADRPSAWRSGGAGAWSGATELPRPTPQARAAPAVASRLAPPAGQAYAGLFERLVALLVDATLILLVFLLMAIGAVVVTGGPGALIDPAPAADVLLPLSGLFGLFEALVVAVYFVFFTAVAGGTPGKRARRLRVVQEGGDPVGAGRALLRFVAYFLELIPGAILAGIVGGLMAISAAFLFENRALGLVLAAIGVLLIFLGYLWIPFDPRKQAWHDKIARTVVVRV